MLALEKEIRFTSFAKIQGLSKALVGCLIAYASLAHGNRILRYTAFI